MPEEGGRNAVGAGLCIFVSDFSVKPRGWALFVAHHYSLILHENNFFRLEGVKNPWVK